MIESNHDQPHPHESLRVLLVNPPYQRLRGIASEQLPLGILYLATVLNQNGIRARVLNCEEEGPGEHLVSGYVNAFENYRVYRENLHNPEHPAWKEYRAVLTGYQPHIVGFSVMTPMVPLSLEMAGVAKETVDPFVVFGGPHPTLSPQRMVRHDTVDAVVVGEGERSFLELAKRFHGPDRGWLHQVPSAVFLDDDGRIITNDLEPHIRNLDDLPFPDYSLLVRPSPPDLRSRFGLVTGRGCPHRCTFCVDHLLWRKKSRFRSAPNIIEEIRLLYTEYGLTNLFFQQDSFLNNRALASSVAREIIRSNMRFSWWCAARVDQIDDELLKLLKASGLAAVILGIESGSQAMLDAMNKKITIPQIERAVDLIKSNGIQASGFFMIGLPDETEEDVRKTIDIIRRLPLDFRSLSVFTPFPGSVLYDRAVDLNLMPRQVDWGRFDYQSPENHFTARIPKERFRELVRYTSHVVDELNAAAA